MTGRKRHLLVDTLGNLLAVVCHPANISDVAGAKLVLGPQVGRWNRLACIWCDSGYRGTDLADWTATELGARIEIVVRPSNLKEFRVLPRRWVVERSIAWLGRSRRLAKDHERYGQTTEGFIWITEVQRLLKRLTTGVAI